MSETMLDEAVLEEMRAVVRSGGSPADALSFLVKRLRLEPDGRLLAVRYFKEAFRLPLQAAIIVGAWEYFDGASWSPQQVNEELEPHLKKHQKK